MTFNEIVAMQARARELKQQRKIHVVSAPDIQHAELAMQAMGHPAWDQFHVHLQQLLVETQGALVQLKDRWAVAYNLPHEDAYMHQQAAGMQARIATLVEILSYLPNLVKKVQEN